MKIATLLKVLGCFAAILGVLFGMMLLLTRGTVTVADTVAGNPSLPVLSEAPVRLHGQIFGDDTAPLVIVLHGGPGGDHRSLLALNALSDRYRVLFYDQRGAGLSERVAAQDLSVAHHLSDLDSLVRQYANAEQVSLIGHSWGAMLAVAYMGAHPNTVANAVLIEPGFLEKSGYDDFETLRSTVANSPRVLWAGLKAGFAARNVLGDRHAQHDHLIGSVVSAFANHPDTPYHCPDVAYSAPSWRFGGLASDTFWANPDPALEAMRQGVGHPAPILFLSGGCNDWTGTELQDNHARLFPNARVATIQNAGHDVIWDQPEAALQKIRHHLAQ